MATGSRPHATGDVADLVVELHQTPREQITDRWNLIQRILSHVDPSTEAELALVEALNELVDMQGGVAPPGGDFGVGEGEGTVADIARLLALQVQGHVDTRDLPIGATGRSIREIPNGDEGIAVFQVQGNKMAVPITAESDIGQFEQVRVIAGPGNTAKPIPAEDATETGETTIERAEVFGVAVDSGEDILPTDQAVRPKTGGSELVVGVTLDTAAVVQVRVNPDDADADPYTTAFNGAAATQEISAGDLFEFEHHFGRSVELNYRVDTNGVTVRQLRVVESIQA